MNRSLRYLAGGTLALIALGVSCRESPGGPDRSRPAALSLVAGDAQDGVVGTELPAPLVARVVDDDGDPVRGQLVVFVVTSGAGKVFAGRAISDRDGLVQERWTLGTSTAVPQAVEARAVDNATGRKLVFATFTATVRADVPDTVSVASGSGQVGVPGAALGQPLVARVADRFGNPVRDVVLAWSATAGSVIPAGPTDANGLAQATWTLGCGTTLEATAAAGSVAPAVFAATSAGGTGSGAPTVRVLSAPPSAPAAGSTHSVGVLVVDACGTPVAGAPVTWTLSAGGGTLLRSDAATDAAGTATADWRMPAAGGVGAQLTAAAGGGSTVVTVVTGPPPPVVRSVGISPQEFHGIVGDTVRLHPVAFDASGVEVVGLSATYSSLFAGVASVDAQGLLTLLGPGWTTIDVTMGGVSTSIYVTAAATAPATLQIVSGNGQSATASTTLPAPIVVRVLDARGNPSVGAFVDFRIESGLGRLVTPRLQTGGDGTASTLWSLGPNAGTQSVTASIQEGSSVTFVAHAKPFQGTQLGLELVVPLSTQPVQTVSPPGDPRMFIVEQQGTIEVFDNGRLLSAPFLDLRSRIASGGERGLFSMAFDPQYATNGFFYVSFTDLQGNSHVERFQVSSDRNVADPTSGQQVLFLTQPFANHNGGHILFGPDGMLYIAFGDGGSGADPFRNGQNLSTMLGKLLRIDVSQGLPYRVPASNPFVGQSGVPGEIWALGLRNPWRIAFDAPAGLLYVADVGEGTFEEIDVVPAGQGGINFGWSEMEGTVCFRNPACDKSKYVAPAIQYDHSDGQCSIIGGMVYRGSRIPELVGHYVYSDFCAGWLRSIKYENGGVVQSADWGVRSASNVLGFGQGTDGELYLTTFGGIYRIIKL